MGSMIRCDICCKELRFHDRYYVMNIEGHNIDQIYDEETGLPLRPELGTFHICHDCFPKNRFEQYLRIGKIYL